MSSPVKTEIKKSWRLLAVSESSAVSVPSSCSSCLTVGLVICFDLMYL